MSPTSIGILAVGMSIDALIASMGRGAVERHGLASALKTGAVFGIIETLTPLIGWSLGLLASQYVQAVDHWIAFALLSAIGVKMIVEAITRVEETDPAPRTPWALIATAVGTSIDAMAVGVSLAFLDVNILVVAAAIGLATTVMATAGILAGRYLSARIGRIAEGLGGLALIGLGLSILIDHLFLG